MEFASLFEFNNYRSSMQFDLPSIEQVDRQSVPSLPTSPLLLSISSHSSKSNQLSSTR